MKIEVSQVANLPSRFGAFKIQAFKEGVKEHLVIFKPPFEDDTPLVRIHSECLTGDAIGSMKCDCRDQLEYALAQIDTHGGMVIYLRQEGRDIGLLNKVNAYALQDTGLDTVAANHQLGFKDDERTYEVVEYILSYFGITKLKLLTNNPKKIESIKGVQIVERIPIIMNANPHNESYLAVKKDLMGHLI
jgi:GTP cyclohydrolase II